MSKIAQLKSFAKYSFRFWYTELHVVLSFRIKSMPKYEMAVSTVKCIFWLINDNKNPTHELG